MGEGVGEGDKGQTPGNLPKGPELYRSEEHTSELQSLQ